jgi:acetolactate synthase-1/2/3 large subunit
MRVSEQIADWLVRQGIEQVFTVTGGGAMFLNQALGSHPGLRCTFMHHEQACAMAAEGYARAAGKPAVAMLTTGPGAINALNGVFGAYTDSIPMLVISGQVKRETCLSFQHVPGLRQLGDQEGPTVAMAQSICKQARIIRSPDEVAEALPEALTLATRGRPGPVWIDIPLDVQSAEATLPIPDLARPADPVNPALEAACDRILDKLRGAHRPLILGGTGVRLAGAVDALRGFVETHGIPVATAWTHDLIESDHPLFAGRPGTIGTRAGNFCLQNADVVLVIGSRLNIRQTSYNWDSFGKRAWIAQVDIDPAELHKPGVQADEKLVADAAAFLAALQAKAHGLPDFGDWAAWCRDIGQRYAVQNEHRHIPGGVLNPYVVVDRVFLALRPDDIVACGNASACILPFQMSRLQRGQRLFSNSGSASMGYDLPAALGAAMADRRRVICFAGDGSLQMNIQELQTLKTTQANVVVIVLNNAGYLSIWQTHENFFGRVIGATPATGVEFPDFNAVATAYGIPNALISQDTDMERLAALLQQDGPLLLNVIVDPRQEFAPRIKSRVGADGKFITPELDDMHPFLDPALMQQVRASGAAVRSKPARAGA